MKDRALPLHQSGAGDLVVSSEVIPRDRGHRFKVGTVESANREVVQRSPRELEEACYPEQGSEWESRAMGARHAGRALSAAHTTECSPALVGRHPAGASDPGVADAIAQDGRGPFDGGDATKDLRGRDRGIVAPKGIAFRDQYSRARADVFAYHAVHKQALPDPEQDDIRRVDFLDRAVMHDKDVARPDGGKHAGAGDPQPYLTEAFQHFGQQDWGGPCDQEAFFTVLH